MIPPDNDDTILPPAHEHAALPELPASNDTEPPSSDDGDHEVFGDIGFDPPVPVIAAGQAQRSVSAALDQLAAAFALVEAYAMACARQLDAQTEVSP